MLQCAALTLYNATYLDGSPIIFRWLYYRNIADDFFCMNFHRNDTDNADDTYSHAKKQEIPLSKQRMILLLYQFSDFGSSCAPHESMHDCKKHSMPTKLNT